MLRPGRARRACRHLTTAAIRPGRASGLRQAPMRTRLCRRSVVVPRAGSDRHAWPFLEPAARSRVYHPAMRLVLASASPRRRELLDAAGFAFDVAVPDVDERREPDEPPARYVLRLARTKAET